MYLGDPMHMGGAFHTGDPMGRPYHNHGIGHHDHFR